ncbi:DUF6452 family protein [Flavobacteriaceae bacterium F08102]|nr:DUF6452 family protein [Flavobacteriaceae bacterium F08102]
MNRHHRINIDILPKKTAITLFLLLTVCISLISCERDEICIDAITPHLIIRFYDQEAPEDFKTPNLEVQILGLPDTLRFTADSIALPLRVNAPETVYILSTVEGTDRNPDTLTVSYDINDLFIGRACGYKSVFVNPVYQRTPDGDTWISSFISTNELIENEQNAHLNIYH